MLSPVNFKELESFEERQGALHFANHVRRLLVIAHSDEGAVPQVSGIHPFDEDDLADPNFGVAQRLWFIF